MRKILLFSAFLTATITLLIVVIVSTIEAHKATIDRIAPATEELRDKAQKMGPLRLTEEEVKVILQQLNSELIHLHHLKWAFIATTILILVTTLFAFLKFNFAISRYDGLTLLILTFLLFSFHSLVYEFSGNFYGGHNASMNVRTGILFGTFVVPPFLFYLAYRMNSTELSLNLHKQKWISYTAITLATICFVLALIVGIGVLTTPDLSGNIS